MNQISSILLLSLTIFTISTLVEGHDFNICSGKKDLLGIAAVSISPDPIQPGSTLTFKISGGPTSVEVTGGTATLSVSIYGATILSLPFDVCSQFGITCPVAKGEKWNGGISYPIPKEIPTFGSVTAKIDITDKSGSELTCFTMVLKLGEEETMQQMLYRRLNTFLRYFFD